MRLQNWRQFYLWNVHLKGLKKIIAKFVANFFVFGNYISQQFVPLPLKLFCRVLCIVMCGMFNCPVVSLVDLRGLQAKAPRTSATLCSVTGCLSRLFADAASLTKQFISLVNRHFCLWFLPKHHANLLCSATAALDSWNHWTQLAFSIWDTIFTDVSSATSGKIWKLKWHLNHVSY